MSDLDAFIRGGYFNRLPDHLIKAVKDAAEEIGRLRAEMDASYWAGYRSGVDAQYGLERALPTEGDGVIFGPEDVDDYGDPMGYRRARGAIRGSEPAEIAIRRMRGGSDEADEEPA